MERLTDADLRAALEVLERIGSAGDIETFAELLVAELRSAIPADVFAYNEVDPALQRAFFITDAPIETELPDARVILERHMQENPLVAYTALSRDFSARKWSDFVTRRELHATELWNGLFRPFGIEHQMVAVLPAPAPLLVGVVINRCARDFSERDRSMLNLLRPHLTNAYSGAQARSVRAALESEISTPDESVVVVGKLGEPLALSPQARKFMGVFGPVSDNRVSEAVVEWCKRARSRAPLPPEPLIGEDGDFTVEARLLNASVILMRARHKRVDASLLTSLSLTRREAEVLALLAKGETNKEIAVRLDVNPSTVKKHLEHIYEKLGVHTRTAAAATALSATERAT